MDFNILCWKCCNNTFTQKGEQQLRNLTDTRSVYQFYWPRLWYKYYKAQNLQRVFPDLTVYCGRYYRNLCQTVLLQVLRGAVKIAGSLKPFTLADIHSAQPICNIVLDPNCHQSDFTRTGLYAKHYSISSVQSFYVVFFSNVLVFKICLKIYFNNLIFICGLCINLLNCRVKTEVEINMLCSYICRQFYKPFV